jgi:hypothetical protein
MFNRGDIMNKFLFQNSKIILLVAVSLFLISACSTNSDVNNNSGIPEGFKLIESTHGSYQYILPENWEKTGANCYQGNYGKAFEQIYPPAEITGEYCSSMVYVPSGDIEAEEIKKHLYNNGQIEGCFIVRNITNVKLNQQWISTSFSFSTSRGVENLTVNVEKPNYDENQVLTIINSISIK